MLQSHQINWMPPPKSLDINSTENLRIIVKRYLYENGNSIQKKENIWERINTAAIIK